MTATDYTSRYACSDVIDARQQYRPYYDNYKRCLISQRGSVVIGFVGCEYLDSWFLQSRRNIISVCFYLNREEKASVLSIISEHEHDTI